MRYAVVLIALLLAGCAADTVPSDRATEQFVTYLRDEGIIPKYGDPAELVQRGHDICEQYQGGAQPAEVIGDLIDDGIPEFQAGQVQGSAMAAWCPEFYTQFYGN